MSWRAILSALAVGILLGCGLGYWFHGSPRPTASVRAAVQAVRTDTKRRDSIAVVVQRDTDTVVKLLPQLEIAATTVDVHDSASVVRLASLARAVAPACRDLKNDCAALHAADLKIIADKDREIAARAAMLPPRLTASMLALYDPVAAKPDARLETNLRLFSHLSAVAEVERGLGVTDSTRVRVGARWTF